MNQLAFAINGSFNSPFGVTVGIGQLISIIVSNAIAIAGVIVFVLFLVAGFIFLSGESDKNQEKIVAAQKFLTAAIIGFIIVFASYWIVQLVEVLTGVNIFNVTF